jgi:hypothetical protein
VAPRVLLGMSPDYRSGTPRPVCLNPVSSCQPASCSLT